MHYLIYKITNKLNGKIYIGQHVTEDLDDGYMGSGLAIRRAIEKYGTENFSKEILFDVDDWELMNFIEELIVDEEFVKREDTYNVALGGQGGYLVEFTEDHKNKISQSKKGMIFTKEHRRKISEAKKKQTSPMKGRHHSEESRKKMSESLKNRYQNTEVVYRWNSKINRYTARRIKKKGLSESVKQST